MSETTAPATVVYESSVTAVGGQVEEFLAHGMLIFFADESPAELHDMSVRHTATVSDAGPRAGDILSVGDVSMEVLAVGSVVSDNLLQLGHLDLKANGLTEAELPGDVNVAKQPLPLPSPGDAFRITRSGQPSPGESP
ncbi:PTS glucitol/sorbitol transporter subunit IIA [Aeromicrobium sp.]|uniref:PTS glucitol/sorbitol transporter subunit IIA n=1 Tax=Aeromicrobium sp. TaxID=1871063 RepID=UPI003C6305AF